MRGRRWKVIAATTAAVLTLGACGDDDEEGTSASVPLDSVGVPSTVASPTTESDSASTVADSEPDGSSGTGSADSGPPEEGGPFDENPCAAGASGEVPEEEQGPAPAADAIEVEVSATEYAFDGLDEIASTGDYAITFTNEGAQLHEVIIVRIADEETRPIEELLQEEDASSFTTDIAFSFACPGESAEPVAAAVDEPGRYVAVCFLPVGATPETEPEEFETLGPPHAFEGMVEEFTVS